MLTHMMCHSDELSDANDYAGTSVDQDSGQLLDLRSASHSQISSYDSDPGSHSTPEISRGVDNFPYRDPVTN